MKGRLASWNTIYSQNSQWKRKVIVDSTHQQVRDAMLEQGIRPNGKFLMPTKVNIDIKASFKGKRIYDSDNIFAKGVIDSFKGWLLVDDTPEYVGKVSTESFFGDEDMVVIDVSSYVLE